MEEITLQTFENQEKSLIFDISKSVEIYENAQTEDQSPDDDFERIFPEYLPF